jgi:hypothetical protein
VKTFFRQGAEEGWSKQGLSNNEKNGGSSYFLTFKTQANQSHGECPNKLHETNKTRSAVAPGKSAHSERPVIFAMLNPNCKDSKGCGYCAAPKKLHLSSCFLVSPIFFLLN